MKNCREEFQLGGDVGRFTDYYLIFVRDGSQFLRDPLANYLLFFLLWKCDEMARSYCHYK